MPAKQARTSKSKVAKFLECLAQNQCIHTRLVQYACNTVLWAEVIMQNERPKVYIRSDLCVSKKWVCRKDCQLCDYVKDQVY